MLTEGDPAPDFTLQGVHQGEIETYSLDELTEDTHLVVTLYVYDYSPVCTDQLCRLDDLSWLSLDEGVNVVGVCGDGPYSHMEFASDHGLDYPLLCDTAQEMASAYGILNASKDGFDEVPQRALFLVSPEQRVTYAWRADDNWDEWDEEPVEAVRECLGADAAV